MKIADIVIPAVNEKAYIQRCLESVFAFVIPCNIHNIHATIYMLDGGLRIRTKAIGCPMLRGYLICA